MNTIHHVKKIIKKQIKREALRERRYRYVGCSSAGVLIHKLGSSHLSWDPWPTVPGWHLHCLKQTVLTTGVCSRHVMLRLLPTTSPEDHNQARVLCSTESTVLSEKDGGGCLILTHSKGYPAKKKFFIGLVWGKSFYPYKSFVP